MTSQLKKRKLLERQIAAMDSPMSFSDCPDAQFSKGQPSPITDLTNNLNSTTLNTPLRPNRKLCLSSVENTPTGRLSDIMEVSFDSPAVGNSLLKSAAKLATPTTTTSQMFGRPRDFRRRLHAMPSSLSFDKCLSPFDKENMGAMPSVLDIDQDTTTCFSPPKKKCASPSKVSSYSQSPFRRQPLEDQDPNSQDSGFGDKEDMKMGFRFAEPLGLAPRRHIMMEQSPQKLVSPPSSPSCKITASSSFSPLLHHSLSSGSDSVDDGFPEFLELDKLDEDTQLPSGINDLLSGPIIKNHSTVEPLNASKDVPFKLPFRRCFSWVERGTLDHVKHQPHLKPSAPATVTSENEEQCPTIPSFRPFKRPKTPSDDMACSNQKRRKKFSSLQVIGDNLPTVTPPSHHVLKRSLSENEATIMNALQRSSMEPDLIGDFSKPFALPLTHGRHQDLKAISCATLAAVIDGKYNHLIDSYSIIDCRYPYEYDGGHIKGAKNMYTKDQIMKELMEAKTSHKGLSEDTAKRNVLIFHCEFSSERGPNLSRFLRNMDRDHNEDRYPALHYPELYLLHGGYKEFFENYNHLCEPCSYQPMADPKHESDLRHFRAKSKSWSGDTKNTRLAIRSSLKRLGL